MPRRSQENNGWLAPSAGKDRPPKRVKEEERHGIGPNRWELTTSTLPEKAGANGPHHPRRETSLVLEPPRQPDSEASDDERPDPRGGFGPTSPTFKSCRSQVGEMPHWCLECGKNFGQKAELDKHQLSHTGQCSYICSDCGRSFRDHIARPTHLGVCPAGHFYSHPGCRRKSLPLSSEAVVQRKERKELSLQEKVRVLEMLDGPKVSQSELAKRFGVSQPQICRIIKNKERILAEWCRNTNPGRKRKLEDKGSANNAALLQWFQRRCVPGTASDGVHVPGKANPLSERSLWKPACDASLSWLTSFQAGQKAELGSPLVEKRSREPLEEDHWESTVLPYFLSKYDAANIYACGEAALLFRAVPEDLPVASREEAQDQLTTLLCTNLDASDKRDILVIGKEAQPFGCQGVRQEKVPVTYRVNCQAWMTAAIFTEWLQTFNADMKGKQRKVALFLLQCGAHPYMGLSNVKMVFIPLSPSQFHPLEQGIVQRFKCHYRRRMLTRLLVMIDSRAAASTSKASEHLTLSDAIHTAVQAWSEVCPQTVTDSFRAAGFGSSSRTVAPPADVLRALGFTNQEQFERFVLVDDGLECFGDTEGTEMPKEAQQQREDPAAEPGERMKEGASPLACPSKAEVMESLAKLRRYFERHAVSPSIFQAFYKLEDMVHGLSLAHIQELQAKALHN